MPKERPKVYRPAFLPCPHLLWQNKQDKSNSTDSPKKLLYQ